MNQDNDRPEATDVDPQVSSHYASLADEVTPANLDQAILRDAARAARTDNRRGSFGAWFRPVAFMATVGLSLAMILDLSNTSIFSPPADMPVETVSPMPAAVDDTADVVGKNRSDPKVIDFIRQEKSGSAPGLAFGTAEKAASDVGETTGQTAAEFSAPDPAQEEIAAVGDVFSTEVENTRQRIDEAESASGAYLQPQPGVEAPLAETFERAPTLNLYIAEPLRCTDEQRSELVKWWQCIEELENSGQPKIADRELEYLLTEFPDFTPPE
jgi:hypothetical protein